VNLATLAFQCHQAQRHLQQKTIDTVARVDQKRKILGLWYPHWMHMKNQLQYERRDLTTRMNIYNDIDETISCCEPVVTVGLPHLLTMTVIVSLGK
jgi:hypothetical protein